MGIYSDGISVMGSSMRRTLATAEGRGRLQRALRPGRKVLVYNKEGDVYLPSRIISRITDGYIVDTPWTYNEQSFVSDHWYGRDWILYAHRKYHGLGDSMGAMWKHPDRDEYSVTYHHEGIGDIWRTPTGHWSVQYMEEPPDTRAFYSIKQAHKYLMAIHAKGIRQAGGDRY